MSDYALGAHTASLGLAFYELPAKYAGGAFVGQHGSWNRKPRKRLHGDLRSLRRRPAGSPQDVLTGFLGADGEALGRPVGVAINCTGALLVADDVCNAVWRVAPAAS